MWLLILVAIWQEHQLPALCLPSGECENLWWLPILVAPLQMATKVGSQILATKFGFVPDCLMSSPVSYLAIPMIKGCFSDTGTIKLFSVLFHVVTLSVLSRHFDQFTRILHWHWGNQAFLLILYGHIISEATLKNMGATDLQSHIQNITCALCVYFLTFQCELSCQLRLHWWHHRTS